MKKSNYLSDNASIDRNNTAIQNSKSHPEILNELSEMGYPSEKIDEGIGLNNDCLAKLQHRNTETDEAKIAANEYSEIKDSVMATYRNHRRKGRRYLIETLKL